MYVNTVFRGVLREKSRYQFKPINTDGVSADYKTAGKNLCTIDVGYFRSAALLIKIAIK